MARLSACTAMSVVWAVLLSCGDDHSNQRFLGAADPTCAPANACADQEDATAAPAAIEPAAGKSKTTKTPKTEAPGENQERPPEVVEQNPPPVGALPAYKGSKLGLHMLGFSVTAEARLMLGACPRIAKWMTGYGSSYIPTFKSQCPNSIVVLRPFVSATQAHYDASSDPVVIRNQAEHYWRFMQDELLKAGIDKNLVDWLEGPNELDNLPDWYHDYKNAEWFAKFWDVLADLIHNAGYQPLVGSVASGNPSLAGELRDSENRPLPNAMKPLADVIKNKKYAIAWSYHGYSRFLSQSVEQEKWYSLRYRTTVKETGLEDIPLLITEGGQDFPKGWLYHDPARGAVPTPEQYMEWLAWYDQQIIADNQVVGVTLYQIGNFSDWGTFDLTGIAKLFKDYIER